MKKYLKKFITEIDYHISYNNKSRIVLFVVVLVSIIIGLPSFILGYKHRDPLINTQNTDLCLLKSDTTNLRDLIANYDVDILAYNAIIEDKDYLRYVAFKYSDITVPKHVPKEDLKLINRYTAKFDVPQKYIWRLINKESRFKPDAKSHKGASGYMQIMPATYNSLLKTYERKHGSISKYNHNQKNLILGIYYLRILHNKYNDWTITFAAYNAGPGNVDNSGGKVPNFNETKNYVKYISQTK